MILSTLKKKLLIIFKILLIQHITTSAKMILIGLLGNPNMNLETISIINVMMDLWNYPRYKNGFQQLLLFQKIKLLKLQAFQMKCFNILAAELCIIYGS